MKKYLLVKFCLLLAACSTEEASPPEQSNDSKTQHDEVAFQYVCEIGLPRFYDQNLPDYQLKAAVVNSYHSLLFYYNEETEQVRFYVEEGVVRPISHNSPYFDFETEKTVTCMYITLENGEVVLKEITPSELPEEEQKDFTIGNYGYSMGYGFKLAQNEPFTFKGRLTHTWLDQEITISYDPNIGWQTIAKDFTPDHDINLAQVFGFSKIPMYEQFKAAFHTKNECFVKSKAPPFDVMPVKFKLSKSDETFSADIIVQITKNDLLVLEQPMTSLEILRALEELYKTQLDPEFPPSLNIVISPASNDTLIRELIDVIKYELNFDYSVTIKK